MKDQLVIPRDQSEFFDKNGLITPPSTLQNNIQKRDYRYIIDSRDRNLAYYPNPNSYEIQLTENIHDVQSVELVSYEFPFTKYLINESNNTFIWEKDSTVNEFTISTGDYESGEDFVDELNANKATSSFSFAWNSLKKCIKINAIDKITLKNRGADVKRNSYDKLSPTYRSKLMKVIGLGLDDIEIQGTYTFPYKVNFKPEGYIIMNIGRTTLNFSENDTTHKCFALIKKDDIDNKYIDKNYIKYYNPPIPAMNSIKVTFHDYDGEPYDFQNQDHVFELNITCFKNQRKYADIFG